MEAKLTLKMNKKVIESAKLYAKKHNRSLSGLVENYFGNLSSKHDSYAQEHSPVVESLSGIFTQGELEKFAREDERARYIIRKEL